MRLRSFEAISNEMMAANTSRSCDEVSLKIARLWEQKDTFEDLRDDGGEDAILGRNSASARIM